MTTINRSPVPALRIKFGRDAAGNRTVTARRVDGGTSVRRQVATLDSYNRGGGDFLIAAEVLTLLLEKLAAEFAEAVGPDENCPWTSGAWTIAYVREFEYAATRESYAMEGELW